MELSTTDPLTGLLNRRAFYDLAAQSACEQSSGGDEPLSLVYADLDDLKVRNDRAGHEAGDALLLTFADCLRTTFRDSDLLARMGGDEFCCLLPHPMRTKPRRCSIDSSRNSRYRRRPDQREHGVGDGHLGCRNRPDPASSARPMR